MRSSSTTLLAVSLACLTLSGWGKTVADPGDKKTKPAEREAVEYVLQFRFKNEPLAAVEKARRNIARGIEEDEKKAYRKSAAANETAFAIILKGMRERYSAGSPIQKDILREVDRYLETISAKTPAGGIRFKVQPNVNLLKSVERDLKVIDGASPQELKSGSRWRNRFALTKRTNILIAACEGKWADEQFFQVGQILTDPAAELGLARFAGFYIRVLKELPDNKTEKEIGMALDMWVVAPEEVKNELMQAQRLTKYLKDPAKYVETYRSQLVEKQGENNDQVRAFRDERTKNEARLKAICQNRVKLFPGCLGSANK